MAVSETPEELAQRYERETRRVLDERESNLENSLADFKVGSVPYLNAVPLTRGLEEQLVYAHPSELAKKLETGELDAALLSITAPLFGNYDILDGIAIASLGEVQSVLLAHRRPLEQLREIYCDPASLASLHLLKMLLAERDLNPEFKPLAGYTDLGMLDAFFLIGDQALKFLLGPHEHEIWDLGYAWYEMTQLPFVYAAWALRRDRPNAALRRALREAKSFGMDTLDSIISSRQEFDYGFRKDYLGWHIHYHLGSDERKGIAKFSELLQKHGFGPVYQPRFVI